MGCSIRAEGCTNGSDGKNSIGFVEGPRNDQDVQQQYSSYIAAVLLLLCIAVRAVHLRACNSTYKFRVNLLLQISPIERVTSGATDTTYEQARLSKGSRMVVTLSLVVDVKRAMCVSRRRNRLLVRFEDYLGMDLIHNQALRFEILALILNHRGRTP